MAVEGALTVHGGRGAQLSYGQWTTLLARVLLRVLVIGTQYSYAVFYLRMLEEFGDSRASLSGVQSTVHVIEGLVFPLAGWLVDRERPRRMTALGALLMALGVSAAGLARAVWQLHATLGVVATLGASLVKIGVAVALTPWFPAASRGRAFGVAYAGNGAAAVVLFPLANWAAGAVGWRSTYAAMAGVVAAGRKAARQVAA